LSEKHSFFDKLLTTSAKALVATHGGLRRALRSTRLGTSPAGCRGVIL